MVFIGCAVLLDICEQLANDDRKCREIDTFAPSESGKVKREPVDVIFRRCLLSITLLTSQKELELVNKVYHKICLNFFFIFKTIAKWQKHALV